MKINDGEDGKVLKRVLSGQGGQWLYTRVPESPAPVDYPDYDGHAMWMPCYQETALWPWLLSWRKSGGDAVGVEQDKGVLEKGLGKS